MARSSARAEPRTGHRDTLCRRRRVVNPAAEVGSRRAHGISICSKPQPVGQLAVDVGGRLPHALGEGRK